MRDNLFRGKTKDGRWVYGSLILAGSYCCILELEENVHPMDYPYLDDDLGTIDGSATPVIPETVGQFTGGTDKRCTKIFDGDIVVFTHRLDGYREVPEVVKWSDSLAAFIVEDKDGKWDYLMLDEYEVIGNIYDNPELLEE